MRSQEEIQSERRFIFRVRRSLALLNKICFGPMNMIAEAHAALIEGQEQFIGDTVEYWSAVRDERGVQSVEIVLRVAERCPSCHRSKSVFVIRAAGAQCKDCDERTPVAQADGLPSADDLDAYFAEQRIAEETA